MAVGPDILSDTMGVDFGPYMRRVIQATYRSWIPIIPESARPPLDKQGRVGVRFKIYPDGSVKEMILEFPSGDVSLDRAAWGGITGASPYPPLPKEFKGPFLELRFGFYYNLDPDKHALTRASRSRAPQTPDLWPVGSRGPSFARRPGPLLDAQSLSPWLVESLVEPQHPLLVVILGPTGSGKTSLSVALAQQFDGEIISCDSVAVYQGLEIGSAKPSAEQRKQVPHHLLDVVTPDAFYTAGDYSRAARAAIAAIAARGKLPIVTGGTGLYLRALLQGLFPGPQRSAGLRDRLLRKAETRGPASLAPHPQAT